MPSLEWSDVVDRLAANRASAGALLQECLRIVADDPQEVCDALCDTREHHSAVVRKTASLLVRGMPQSFSELTRLLDVVRGDAGPLFEAPVIAHIVACAIDEACFDDLITECEAKEVFELGDGDWFPRPQLDLFQRLAEVLGQGEVHLGPRTTHRESTETNPAQTPRTALFRKHHGLTWTVQQNWKHSSELEAALTGLPAAATVHPIAIDGAKLVPSVVGGGSFGLGPADSDGAWQQTVEGLKRARSRGARVAVVPELVVGPDAHVDLDGLDVPDLVLSGSRHLREGEHRRNRAVLHLGGRAVVEHDKINPFGDRSDTDPDHNEAIHPGTKIEILRARNWAVVPLICADVNDSSIVNTLCQVHANLILVASMTASPGYFETNLCQVTRTNQGLALWANQPVSSTDQVDTAAFYLAGKTRSRKRHRDNLPRVRRTDWSWVR